MAPAHGEPHDDDEHDKKLKEALHGAQIRPGRRRLPSQASDTAEARSGGQRGTAQRSETAAEKAKGPRRRKGQIILPHRAEGAVVQGPDGPTVVPLADAHEEKVANPKLGSYDAIAEVLD